MRKLFARIRLFWALLRIRKNPGLTNYIFDISDSLVELGLFEQTMNRVMLEPANQDLIQKRTLLKPIILDHLMLLPEVSLGHQFARHMKKMNLDPLFYRLPEGETDIHYFLLRMRQTHDLWHIVTGFDISEGGEIGLQAFMMSHVQAPLSPILVGGAIFRTGLDFPDKLIPLMELIVRGWMMGKTARGFFAYDWDSAWAKPLAQVRKELGLPEGIGFAS